MIGRKGKFWGGSEKQSALELRWRQAADCSTGGFQSPETHDRRRWTAVYVGSLVEMSGNVFINPIPSHSQWFIPIPIREPRFSLVLFPFPSHSHWLFPLPPAPMLIQVNIFCQFTAALLLIVFWVAEIIKVKDTALLSWWAMTVECVTVRRSSRRSWCTTTDGLLLFLWLQEMGKCGVFIHSMPIMPFPFPSPFPWN